MMIVWGRDDSRAKLERRRLQRVFGDFCAYRRRRALALACMLGRSVRGLAPAVLDTSADQILVMNHGRTVERGTHHWLVDQDGLYATLYERQFRATADPDDLTAIGVAPTP